MRPEGLEIEHKKYVNGGEYEITNNTDDCVSVISFDPEWGMWEQSNINPGHTFYMPEDHYITTGVKDNIRVNMASINMAVRICCEIGELDEIGN